MWYPVAEWPPQPVIDAFDKLGVTSRKMDFRLGCQASLADLSFHPFREYGIHLPQPHMPTRLWSIVVGPTEASPRSAMSLHHVSSLSGLNFTSFKDNGKVKSFDPSGMARFAIKVAATILSRFQEVSGVSSKVELQGLACCGVVSRVCCIASSVHPGKPT